MFFLLGCLRLGFIDGLKGTMRDLRYSLFGPFFVGISKDFLGFSKGFLGSSKGFLDFSKVYPGFAFLVNF